MDNLIKDIKYSVRFMRKRISFTVVAVLALALGIGASSAIFSVVNATLIRPLPYKSPDQIVVVWDTSRQREIDKGPASPPNFIDYRDRNQSFVSMAALRTDDLILAGATEPERVPCAFVSPNLFSLLGVNAHLGRTFTDEESEPGRDNVVVLSYGYWQRHFAAVSSPIGQTLRLDDKNYSIIGIMPKGIEFPGEWLGQTELWLPLAFAPEEVQNRGAHTLFVVGRLKDQVSISAAQNEMQSIANSLEQQYPNSNTGWSVLLTPLSQQVVGDVRPALLLLLGAVLLVLLIGCANVANLLLARAAERQKEIAVRMAIGASRLRLVQQLLTESLLLSLIAGAIGILLAYWGISVLGAVIPNDFPRLKEIGIDARVVGFTLAISFLTAFIFGLVPALQATKVNLNEWLKEGGGKATAGTSRRLMRNALMISELALSLVLLIGAGLLVKSLMLLQKVDPGFKAGNALVMDIALPPSNYPDARRRADFFQQVIVQLKTVPGVQSVGATSILPLSGMDKITVFKIEGRPPASADEQLTVSYRLINSDYFEAMSIPVMQGRSFTERDADSAPLVLMVSESFARRFFQNEEPIGKRLLIKRGGQLTAREIIGVADDVKEFGLDAEVKPQIYIPYLQNPSPDMTLVLRTSSNPAELRYSAREAVWTIDRNQPVYNINKLEDVLSKSFSQRRFNMLLLSLFAGIAMILAATGVYSVMVNSVNQRTRELGIRMALGAQQSHILKLIVGQAVVLILSGVGVGLTAAFALMHILSALLYGVNAIDPAVFLCITLLLSAVALIASYLPARKASKVDPMITLRNG